MLGTIAVVLIILWLLTRPDPGNSDFMICPTGSDHDGIAAALAWEVLEFGRVVTIERTAAETKEKCE